MTLRVLGHFFEIFGNKLRRFSIKLFEYLLFYLIYDGRLRRYDNAVVSHVGLIVMYVSKGKMR